MHRIHSITALSSLINKKNMKTMPKRNSLKTIERVSQLAKYNPIPICKQRFIDLSEGRPALERLKCRHKNKVKKCRAEIGLARHTF
jgi:hypothetical protein